MNVTPLPRLASSPPALKRPLSTMVDGTRGLFRHSVSAVADSACPGWMRLTFWPGWLGKTESGRVCLVVSEVCREGEVEATLERVSREHGVHLWYRPLRLPLTWPRGNWWWPGTLRLDLHAPKLRDLARAVAA